ncbi:MAG: cyclic 2,3-diphosphoglycerate synthase [Candidatus Krumholzibacteria bacterium]|nr:cyclic 2,3-diphosphoglycerate synthase [Candidatus Krumholzibacteria bacterium]MDH4338289.1 cyclic 2,3-diphosphoglycerate synthase [Candidatus Krumholzibacteria bacterium]MDH5268922.1 cyclic 2,3-diphosphoglycerate synthase [Candidatus Krumholzibacteria bacterium]MDH5628345.1 cyclic 2,3-diphosphoglycerate synthase [Candidatus Krumholzibacteria bacterium]
MARTRIVILGAAGRDFHNFNVLYRNHPDIEVVAFTATQIPHIDGRAYPPELAGADYPGGIPIIPETELRELLQREELDAAVFSYSDVPYDYVMRRSALVNAYGADFVLLAPRRTMLPSVKPVIAVSAVRTGSGKSQTTRKIAELMRERGYRVVVVRHPMPYGDLAAQAVQRFGSYEDMETQNCTIEEREEYEHHVAAGSIVYAGVDYASILKEAEKEADVVLWDGGNNDVPFYRPSLWVTVADPHRPGHEIKYYPGEINVHRADVVVMNKMDSADPKAVEQVLANVRALNAAATIVKAKSPVKVVGDAGIMRGKRVLCVEDGPTVTHGEMRLGAAVVAAQANGAAEIVDPRPWVVGEIKETFEKYPHIGPLLPAMGYGDEQIADLEKTINAIPCDVVLIGTPIDLTRLVKIEKPCLRVTYSLEEIGTPTLASIIDDFVARHPRSAGDA